MATNQHPNPYHDLVMESKNYWCAHNGQEHPPAPTYREVNGKLVLGRYMDPYGCLGIIQNTKDRWSKWYTTFLIGAGAGVLFMGVDAVFLFLAVPILGSWYLIKRARHRAIYDRYYRVMEKCSTTGQPQWEPYDAERLKLIEKTPLAVWP